MSELPPSPLLRCPLCRQALSLQDSSLRCPDGHSFDRARQGYFNLLPAQKKRSRSPGDDRAMVTSRRDFLQQGHYSPLSDAVNRMLAAQLAPDARHLLDSGCGEGYYSQRLHEALGARKDPIDLVGLDISKEAIRQATRRSRRITWVVASGADLPLAERSLDGALCLFAPLAPAALHRALKPGAPLLVATTGPDHLLALRQAIYPEVRRDTFDPGTTLGADFVHQETSTAAYTFDLTGSDQILQLLAMTPHQWRTSRDARERLAALQSLRVEVDVRLHLWRARP